MRLTRVYIENFRGVRRLDLELDPVTVVIGENNHGKTSVFDVLELCLGRAGDGEPGRFRAHDFHRCADGEPGTMGPIRVVLTFEPDRDGPLSPAEAPLTAALRADSDGHRRLRAEFLGHVAGAEIGSRFIDERGRPLAPQPPASVLKRLRRLHPMLVVRFSHRPLGSPTDEDAPGAPAPPRGPRRDEAEIAYVYRELAEARGPVPTETLQRGLRAARSLYERIKVRHPSGHGPLRKMLDQLGAEWGSGPGRGDGGGDRVALGGGVHTLSLLMVLGALLDAWGDDEVPAAAHPVIGIEEPEVHLHPILLASTWDVIESLEAQTLITTNSGEFLSYVPLRYLRRLARRRERIEAHRLHLGGFTPEDRRRIGYHVRAKRGGVLFARCWIFVEGESEFWLMRELARVLGYDLDAEGVRCVEFAQCGVGPLVTLANHLGIEWHLLADGDESGARYAEEASEHVRDGGPQDRVTRLKEHDIERCLWYHGYADVYRAAAGLPEEERGGKRDRRSRPGAVIAKAVRNHSKPFLALTVAEKVVRRGPEGVPAVLREVIEIAVRMARSAIDDGSGLAAGGVPARR